MHPMMVGAVKGWSVSMTKKETAPPRIRAVIFDMDGVLFHSEPEYMRRMDLLMRREGYPVSQRALLNTVGTSMEETCRILKEDSGFPRTAEEMMEAYTLWAADNPLPYPLLAEKDALPVLEALKARGYLLGLASSTGRETVESALENAQLRRLLLCAVSSDDVTRKKPDPECYLLAARLMGVEPEACLAVEDTRVGLMAAKAAGMRVLCRAREYPQDLSGADGIVENLSDLLAWAPPLQPRFQGNSDGNSQSDR